MEDREIVIIKEFYFVSLEGFLLSKEYEKYIQKEKRFYMIETIWPFNLKILIVDFKENRR